MANSTLSTPLAPRRDRTAPKGSKRPYARRHRALLSFNGVIRWICPNCGHFNHDRVGLRTWKIECSFNGCRIRWVFGGVFWRIRRRSQARAWDFAYPGYNRPPEEDERMPPPLMPIEEWNGHPRAILVDGLESRLDDGGGEKRGDGRGTEPPP